MKKSKSGSFTLTDIMKGFYEVDSLRIASEIFTLYEVKRFGDEALAIMVSSEGWYTYTCETLNYTVRNLASEFETYNLREEITVSK